MQPEQGQQESYIRKQPLSQFNFCHWREIELVCTKKGTQGEDVSIQHQLCEHGNSAPCVDNRR
jgi:hypothetical protein